MHMGGNTCELIRFTDGDRIAIIATHPGDECLGVSAALLLSAERTDVYVLTDGSHGNADISTEEEAEIRRRQTEEEMAIVKPRSWHWLGNEETTLISNMETMNPVDFSSYTKIFIPWPDSSDSDQRIASLLSIDKISRQRPDAECFYYETGAPFTSPTHYADITELMEKKLSLIRCHEDREANENKITALNRLRAALLKDQVNCRYAEAYQKVEMSEEKGFSDVLVKLYRYKDDPEIFDRIERNGICIKRVMPVNITRVYEFIKTQFSQYWADETLPALIRGDCTVAVRGREILGFTSVEVPAKGFLGPVGVVPEARRMGIAQALALTNIRMMRAKGYKYAIAGRTHPYAEDLIKEIAKVMRIPGSAGAFDDMI